VPKLPALIALLPCCLALALAGCGDDDDETTETVTETVRTSTEASVETCSDHVLEFSGTPVTLTDVSTNAGCENVGTLAINVLSRDDCVEESPGGSNECEAQGYICTTTVPGDGAVVFVVSCAKGSQQVAFSQTRN
jgi:hypothetical protein